MNRPATLLCVLALLPAALVASAAGHHAEVYVYGEKADVQPPARVHEGVPYVPLRAVTLAVGGEVTWLEERQVAVVCRDDRCTDFPRPDALEISGHLLVPLADLAEALGVDADWSEAARQVIIRDGVIGMKALPMSLPGVDGPYERTRYDDKNAVAIIFWANHCPTVIAYEERLRQLADDYRDRGVEFVALATNCVEQYPADSFENMKIRAREMQYNFPYVYDETQDLAHYYGAERTPDVFLVNPAGFVVYRGRIEDNQNPERVQRRDLREALDEMLAGEEISVKVTPPHGCTIKWKK